MTRQRQAIGLDIGAQSVKMAHLGARGDSVSVLNYRIKEYLQQEERILALSEILKDIKAIREVHEEIPIILGIEGSQAFIRVFKLPGVAKSKLAKIIAYEAQQQVPFPIEEVVWSYQCLRQVSPEETDVVLTAVRDKIVRELVDSLGIDVVSAIPPVVGLNNLLSWKEYETIVDPSGQAVMVLDLGAKTTNVIILEKQNLWFRSIPIGGEAVTQAINHEYGISYPDAELFKKEKGEIVLEGIAELSSDRKRISTCIIKSLTRLTSEISRSMEVYSSNFNSLGPRRIFLTGGGARLKDIGDFFGKKFRCDMALMGIDKSLSIGEGLEKDKFSMDVHRLGPVLGLALQGLGFGNIRLNLLPKEMLKKYKWINLQPYVTAVSALVIFLGVCFSGYNIQMSRIYRANINKLDREIEVLGINEKRLIKIQEELNSVKYRMDILGELRDSRNFWLNVLLELEELLPGSTWLVDIESLQQTPEEINLIMRGKTLGTYQDVMTFRDALNNSRYFVKDSGEVISANPPVDGIRDFAVEVRAKVTGE